MLFKKFCFMFHCRDTSRSPLRQQDHRQGSSVQHRVLSRRETDFFSLFLALSWPIPLTRLFSTVRPPAALLRKYGSYISRLPSAAVNVSSCVVEARGVRRHGHRVQPRLRAESGAFSISALELALCLSASQTPWLSSTVKT